MATLKSRINISLSDEIKEALQKISRRDHVPTATKAARLLEVALEIEEDKVWNNLAEKRDVKTTRFLSHKKAWSR